LQSFVFIAISLLLLVLIIYAYPCLDSRHKFPMLPFIFGTDKLVETVDVEGAREIPRLIIILHCSIISMGNYLKQLSSIVGYIR
jgi:hypothetical protein